eukprot:gb/GECG01006477.1/.p1 GENE.gb/GECG01006477.1/~~gb/GECG01006477.1/.p1  ORF type:complete len:512 (+),score=65.42 gb/GECG01006477.1/:1-1536(+)
MRMNSEEQNAYEWAEPPTASSILRRVADPASEGGNKGEKQEDVLKDPEQIQGMARQLSQASVNACRASPWHDWENEGPPPHFQSMIPSPTQIYALGLPRQPFRSSSLQGLARRLKVLGLTRERSHRFKNIPDCLVGRELVEFLVFSRQVATRQHAVNLGQRLIHAGLLTTVPPSQSESAKFTDGDKLYQLLLPSIMDPDEALSKINKQSGEKQSRMSFPRLLPYRSNTHSSPPRQSRAAAALAALPEWLPETSTPSSTDIMSSQDSTSSSTSLKPYKNTSPTDEGPHKRPARARSDATRQSTEAKGESNGRLKSGSLGSMITGEGKDPNDTAWKSPAEDEDFDNELLKTQIEGRQLENRNVKAGYLFKQGHVIKNWKRRWFLLKGHTLVYYRKPGDEQSKGLLDILEYTPALCKSSKRSQTIAMNPKNDTAEPLYIYSESDMDTQKWYNAIKGTIEAFEEWERRLADIQLRRRQKETAARSRKSSLKRIKSASSVGSSASSDSQDESTSAQ